MKGVEVNFPVISDLTMQVSKAFGMLQPGASTTQAVRAVFIIDPEAKVRAILYYPLSNGRNMDEVKRLLIAMRLYNHLRERGARILLAAVEAPPTQWDSPLAAFEAAYEHECKVSRQFDEHMALAQSEKDYATIVLHQWFIKEQVEEEASTDAIVQKIKMIGDHKGGLFMLDRALSERKTKG